MIYEILKLRYVDEKKHDEIITALGCSKPTIIRYCKKISKEEFLSHIESGEIPSDLIEKHPEVFCQHREKHKLTNEHCELIRELCVEHLNCYISKEDALIIYKDNRFETFYTKHQSKWLSENREQYDLEHDKFTKKIEKEVQIIRSGADLGKNYSDVYEIYLEEVKYRNLTPISKESFYLEARKYWTEEE